MGFFNEYPYTNLHEVNLDYILKSIKDLWDYVKSDKWRGNIIFNAIYNEDEEQIEFLDYDVNQKNKTHIYNKNVMYIKGGC